MEAVVCLPPREREELVDILKNELELEEIPPPTMPFELDDMDDPEDLECPWLPCPAASSSSERRRDADLGSGGEPAPKRTAVERDVPSHVDADQQGGLRDKLPQWAPGDKEPLDQDGCECAHYRRRTPLMNKVQAQAEVVARAPDNIGPYEQAMMLLVSWLQLRPGLWSLLAGVERRAYDWDLSEETGSRSAEGMHDWGAYFWCPLKHWVPDAPGDVDEKEMFDKRCKVPLARCIHAASMYGVHRSLTQGLVPGPLPGKGGRTGLFAFEARRATRAQSSSGYAVYSRLLTDSPFLVSPRYEVLARLGLAGDDAVGKLSMGSNQLALQPGMYFLRGVWFHVLTQRDAFFGPPTWVHWDEWDPEYELLANR